MPKLTIIGRNGRIATVDASEGWTVMEIIRAAGFDELLATCGGNCSCGTCHVYVDQDAAAGTRSEDEADLLECSDHRTAMSRLSCQIGFDASLDGLTVRIAPED